MAQGQRPKLPRLRLVVEAELQWANHLSAGFMHFTFEDTTAHVSEENDAGETVPLGDVSGTIGGGINIHLNETGETWHIGAAEFWHALQLARAEAVDERGPVETWQV